VADVRVRDSLGRADVLRLAGAVETHSGHLLARTLVDAAHHEAGWLPLASDIVETPGRGVAGTAEGHRVVVRAPSFLAEQHPGIHADLGPLDLDVGLRAWVSIDGRGAAVVTYADQLRPGLRDTLAAMGDLGIRHLVLLSGDSTANVRAVAAEVGIEDARGDLSPEDKVAAVQAFEATGHRVLMVGDGTNDAPALSTATVGVALAAHGGGISAEAADVVLLHDDIALAGRAVAIGRRAMRIARQSIVVGLGLSGVAMAAAALGYIPPTAGALLQEGIDVAVILNALRASAEAS